VPTAAGNVARSGVELANLVGAQRARGIAAGWTAAAGVLGATATMAAGVALLVGHASHAAGAVIAALGVGAGLSTAACAARARKADQERAARLDAAWESVAGEVLRTRDGDVTASELARVLWTDDAHAETLLSRLSAGGRARVAVTEHADLSYRSVERTETSDEANRAGADSRSREP
jgi:hypothetical protein